MSKDELVEGASRDASYGAVISDLTAAGALGVSRGDVEALKLGVLVRILQELERLREEVRRFHGA